MDGETSYEQNEHASCNLTFPEGPRWHNGLLWFSDFYSGEVITVDENGTRSTIVSVPEQPSGLGWDTQGDLLIVSMRNQKLLRYSNGKLLEHADLSEYSNYWCNDMVVDNTGGHMLGTLVSIGMLEKSRSPQRLSGYPRVGR